MGTEAGKRIKGGMGGSSVFSSPGKEKLNSKNTSFGSYSLAIMGFLSDPNPFLSSSFCKAGTMTLKISFPLCKQIPVCQKGLQKAFKRQEED